MAPTDQELIGRVQVGDSDAFEVLFARYREPVRRRLLQIVREEQVAGDLLQEVFVRVWTRAEQWDGRGAFKPWLFRIATNQAISYLRSPRYRKEQSLDRSLEGPEDAELLPASWMVAPEIHGPEMLALFAEQHTGWRRLVDRLPHEKRLVLRMVHEAEMDVREVAETLGIPEGTVKSRLHYARKWLTREWTKLNIAEEDD